MIRSLSILVGQATQLGLAENRLDTQGLTAAATSERSGRYVRLVRSDLILWFGIDHALWDEHGRTPLWLTISRTTLREHDDVPLRLSSWADQHGLPLVQRAGRDTSIGLTVPVGAELASAARGVLGILASLDDHLA
jgi:hypothetical protein